VSDERLREMERRWRASRSTEDAEAYLRERLRRGAYDMRAVVGELIRLRRLVEVILSTAYQSLGMNKYSTRGDVADFSVAPSPVVGEQIVTMNQMLESSLSTPSAADLLSVMDGRMRDVEVRWSPPGTINVPAPGVLSGRTRREGLYDTEVGVHPEPPVGTPPRVFLGGSSSESVCDGIASGESHLAAMGITTTSPPPCGHGADADMCPDCDPETR